ncbi:MAG TPA: hypothetical protein VE779_08645, partial [Candidatus Angelobacter sp.]|nr:hypothetical protein [Candidatus Angelobacter sp.]
MVRKRFLVGFVFCQMVSFAIAQDTIFVSCWSGKHADVYRERTVRGNMVSSSTGNRAYVTVSAKTNGGGCQNVTRLMVAGPTGSFHRAFEAKPTETDDGNG